jgi:hypothetical protein
MEDSLELFHGEKRSTSRLHQVEQRGPNITSVSPCSDSSAVTVLVAKSDPVVIDWSDTNGAHYLGDWFIAYHRCFPVFLFLLVIAFVGAVLMFFSLTQHLPVFFTGIGLMLATPHIIFDGLLWQRELAKKLLTSPSFAPVMLNNILFIIMVIILAFQPDNEPLLIPLLGLGVGLPAVNCCVHFYDAFHPEIADKGLRLALAALLLWGFMVMASIYTETIDIQDVGLPFGGFDTNAKSLLFGSLQNMVVMWLIQLVKRSRSLPTTLKKISSDMEIRETKTEAGIELVGMSNTSGKNTVIVGQDCMAKIQAIASNHKARIRPITEEEY